MNIAHSENQSVTAATQSQSAPVTPTRPERPLSPGEPQLQNGPPTLQPLLDAQPPAQMALQTSVTGPPVSTIQACLAQASDQVRVRSPHSGVRNGKIARLPKLHRDMVNRMLQNNVPQDRIVAALDDFGIRVTLRNISNWKTRGGYKDWCLEQERQINLSRIQDNHLDYLRKNDAAQLPEVGLQVAATQLSQMFLQPDTAQQLAAHPEKYRQVVDMLCRLSAQIQSLQKDRDQAVKTAAIRDTSECIKHQDEKDIDEVRRIFSGTIGERAGDEVPHRNELPKRDELPFRDPPPKGPDLLDIMKMMRKTPKTPAALPAPQPKPVENPTDEKSVSA